MSIFRELDVVRLKRAARAEQGGGIIVLPRGETGTVVATYPGACMVEFDPARDGGGWLGDVADEYLEVAS